MKSRSSQPLVAIACGGTGGHLFPGVAVAEALIRRGCVPHLLISPKEVDQTAVKSAAGMAVSTLPAVGLTSGSRIAFLRGFFQSWQASKKLFHSIQPDAVLAMGGFTSAPPIFAARGIKIPTFIHESNTIPGRANRWLARFVDAAFVGFAETGKHLARCSVRHTGTPVRDHFVRADAVASRLALGLSAGRPVMLVTGGSQGASGLNDLVVAALPVLAKLVPGLQCIHLTGGADVEKVRRAYASVNLTAVVHAFFADMPLAMSAADVCVSRAGASSLAELAAMGLPSILVPFPAAMDNHQFYNARAFESCGAARLMEQKSATGAKMAESIFELISNSTIAGAMREALCRQHCPRAAEEIAENILLAIAAGGSIPERDGNVEHASLRNRKTATT